jgi:formate dehydrogenase iron-sulfur subunit
MHLLHIEDHDDLLRGALLEQSALSAVDQFEHDLDSAAVPANAEQYKRLLPATPPSPGQQYAFEVDLDACTSCKACVVACHSLNGLDAGESFRRTGSIVGEAYEQTITSTCHHCADPGCLNGCPVNAYEKDAVTGIVRHLDDQCIGCKYCTLTCPYEVPVYNESRGIVRKCDMCTQRLTVGEAPACVQACPSEAIRITLVSREPVPASPVINGAPDSAITRPTTRYVSKTPVPAEARPADAPVPKEAHTPLVIMLVLTQLSVGMYLFVPGRVLASVALALCFIALGASTLHLGRPQYAFRAILGIGHSWLSREIVAFGGFSSCALGYTVLQWIPALDLPWVKLACAGAVILSGLAGVFCSAMLYHVTAKPSWRMSHSGAKFLLTTVLLGAAASGYLLLAILVAAAKLFCELRIHRATQGALADSATLLRGPLAGISKWRFGLLAAGLVLMPVPWVGLALLVAGELCERHLFFAAAAGPRMPGGALA